MKMISSYQPARDDNLFTENTVTHMQTVDYLALYGTEYDIMLITRKDLVTPEYLLISHLSMLLFFPLRVNPILDIFVIK